MFASILEQPLLPEALRAWQAEVAQASGVDARAHWWTEPHWVPWTALDRADTLLAQTVHACRRQLENVCMWPREVEGIEFWTQRRSLNSDLHLHWDCDQERGRLSGELRCPALSLVVYLYSQGGPTLVIEQRPSAAGNERGGGGGTTRCCLSWPREGQVRTRWPRIARDTALRCAIDEAPARAQVLAFGGDLLHGVVGLDTAGQRRCTSCVFVF